MLKQIKLLTTAIYFFSKFIIIIHKFLFIENNIKIIVFPEKISFSNSEKIINLENINNIFIYYQNIPNFNKNNNNLN